MIAKLFKEGYLIGIMSPCTSAIVNKFIRCRNAIRFL